MTGSNSTTNSRCPDERSPSWCLRRHRPRRCLRHPLTQARLRSPILSMPHVVSSAPNPDPLLLPAPPTPTESVSVLASVQNALRARLQFGIQKPKIYSDGTVWYASLITSEKPANLATALTDPNWKKALDS
jgi:hypothetical protein